MDTGQICGLIDCIVFFAVSAIFQPFNGDTLLNLLTISFGLTHDHSTTSSERFPCSWKCSEVVDSSWLQTGNDGLCEFGCWGFKEEKVSVSFVRVVDVKSTNNSVSWQNKWFLPSQQNSCLVQRCTIEIQWVGWSWKWSKNLRRIPKFIFRHPRLCAFKPLPFQS